jgi:Tol biopolymer transport system component
VDAGRITGTPTAAGTADVTLTTTDVAGRTATRVVTLMIGAAGSTTEFDRITNGDGISGLVELSGDGRYLVFGSRAANLVPGDLNGTADVFTFDLATGVLIKITRGVPPEGSPTFNSMDPWSISSDGRYVTFESYSTSLVPGDVNGVRDIFVWDRNSGGTRRVTDGNLASSSPTVSADGGSIAFESLATNLVVPDDNDRTDVFVWRRDTGTISRLTGEHGGHSISLSGDGSVASYNSEGSLYLYYVFSGLRALVTESPTYGLADLSFDGQVVAYGVSGHIEVWDGTTYVSTAVPGNTTSPPSISADGAIVATELRRDLGGVSRQDIQLWHAATGTTEVLTSGSGASYDPSISDDGKTVVFSSKSTHLVPDDTNGFDDVFVWRRP